VRTVAVVAFSKIAGSDGAVAVVAVAPKDCGR